MKRSPVKYIPLLAGAHLAHEWVLTLCLVVALSAVISPLLVLFGLKHGTIQTLRERLVEDPVFRELRPTQTRIFTPEWFAELETWPGVGFCTPTILPLSSVISVVRADSGRSELFDLVPTAPGDPLLLENGGVIPADGQVVLTQEAAARSGLAAGSTLTARISRSRNGKAEVVETGLTVVAVLAQRAGTLARVYAPLSFVLDVEAYKEGYAAPARGWQGSVPVPYPSYDGALVLVPQPLAPIVRSGLIINSGFARLLDADPDRVKSLTGLDLPSGFAAYDLRAPGSPVTDSSLRAIERKLRGQGHVLLPYVSGLQVRAGDRDLPLTGLSLTATGAELLGVPPSPWSDPDEIRKMPVLEALWPDASGSALPEEAKLWFAGASELVFPVGVRGASSTAGVIVPVELAGILRTAVSRPVGYVAGSGTFEMSRGGFRGFRLYAQRIDDVPALYHRLRGQGIEVAAEVQAIERIQVLDKGLTRIFSLLAVLGLVGGSAVLISSLYAAVERLRRDLGVLRLLGFARGHVFFLPVVQGLLIGALGLALGFAGYAALSAAIDSAFTSELIAGESFCFLPGRYVPVFCLLTIGLSALASLVAAWRATCIDPAEVIREQ